MISRKAKYALRALVVLARAGGYETIPWIAAEQKIPRKFLEQILLEMKLHGLLESRRGKAGGYMLARKPAAITFGEVLRLIDGPVAPLPCLSITAYERCADCTHEADCEVRRVFARVADATRAVLDSTTLADAVSVSDSEILRNADI